MADHKTLPVFAYIQESVQLADLRKYLNGVGAKLHPNGPEDVSANLLEICKNVHIIGPKTAPKEVDLILNSVCSLIVTVPADRARDVVAAFCSSVTPEHFKGQSWGSNAGQCVGVLSNIYRAFAAHPNIQEETYKALVAMCEEAHLISELDCSVEALERQFKNWGSDVEKQRVILRKVHSALLADLKADQAAKVMIMLLGTYTQADAGKAREDATECVRTAVVDPKSFSFDHLQRLNAVKALQKSDPQMFEALELFISGTLKNYKEFVKKYPNFVKDHLKVDEEILLKKIRLLTLMTIAETNNTISLGDLSKELDLPEDETLEEFIIEAIRVKAIYGKVDELDRKLVVSSFQHRQFGRDQWVALQKRLQGLISNLKTAHENIKNVNQVIDEAMAPVAIS